MHIHTHTHRKKHKENTGPEVAAAVKLETNPSNKCHRYKIIFYIHKSLCEYIYDSTPAYTDVFSYAQNIPAKRKLAKQEWAREQP